MRVWKKFLEISELTGAKILYSAPLYKPLHTDVL